MSGRSSIHRGFTARCVSRPLARHQAINEVIASAITAAGIPVTKEPVGLTRLDIKQPGRLTLIPWQGGKPLSWDITVVSTLADSYLHSTSHSAGNAAETASIRKEPKYSSLPPDHIFQPVATETLGPLNASALNFLSEPGHLHLEIHARPHFCSSTSQCLYSASTLL